MAVFKRGSVWWYEFEFQGQRIRQSSKSPVKAVCLQAERERRRELERGANNLEKVVKPKLFSGAAKEYLIGAGSALGSQDADHAHRFAQAS